jgi:hypothetical protein
MRKGMPLPEAMTATISGPGFEVSPSEPQTQAISADGDTTWEWDVVARQPGTLTLVFRLSTSFLRQGQALAKDVRLYRKNVEVSVSPADVVERNPALVSSAATIVAGVLAAVLTVWLTVRLQQRHAAKSRALPLPQPVARLPTAAPQPPPPRRGGGNRPNQRKR